MTNKDSYKDNGNTSASRFPHGRKYKVTIPKKPIALASNITDLKFSPRRRTILASKTIMVDTKNSCCWNHKGNRHPCHHVKRIDMVRTIKPSQRPCPHQKVRIYIGHKENKKKVKSKTTTAMARGKSPAPG